MNIPLVYPEIPNPSWSYQYALKLVHKTVSSPPVGLVVRERSQCWKIILRGLFAWPRRLPGAVTPAIYGDRFRIIGKRYILWG